MDTHTPRWLNLALTLLVFFAALGFLMRVLVAGAASAYVPLGQPLPRIDADLAQARFAVVVASVLVLAVSGISLIPMARRRLGTE